MKRLKKQLESVRIKFVLLMSSKSGDCVGYEGSVLSIPTYSIEGLNYGIYIFP